MNVQDILLLVDYNDWANKRILAAADELSLEQFTAPAAYGRGGVRGTLVHVVDGEYSWRELLQSGRLAFDLAEDDFPTLEALKARWQQEEQAMRAYLAGLRDEDLTGLVRYTLESGAKRERVRWHCLVHVVNHGTQHRSEAAAQLTAYGHSPGDLDLTLFLNERAAGRA